MHSHSKDNSDNSHSSTNKPFFTKKESTSHDAESFFQLKNEIYQKKIMSNDFGNKNVLRKCESYNDNIERKELSDAEVLKNTQSNEPLLESTSGLKQTKSTNVLNEKVDVGSTQNLYGGGLNSKSNSISEPPLIHKKNSESRCDTQITSNTRTEVNLKAIVPKKTLLTRNDDLNIEKKQDNGQPEDIVLSRDNEYASGATPVKPSDNQQIIHSRLFTESSDNQYEKEADNFADKVIQMSEHPLNIEMSDNFEGANKLSNQIPSSGQGNLLGRSDSGGMTTNPVINIALSNSKGRGTTLPKKLQDKMEYASGQDLSQVRIHNNDRADKMSRSINAKAFVSGQDIYFKKGQFQPDTKTGQHLMAHEIGHIVNGHTNIQRKIDDYDVVTLGKFQTLWSLAQFYGLNPKEIKELNEKAYVEEYGRTFNPRRLFPNSRIFLPVGTIEWHSNYEAMQVEIKKKIVRNKHIDDPLYPGTVQEYVLRYYVQEDINPDTNNISFRLAVSQKLNIMLEKGTQFSMRITASIKLDSFDVERGRINQSRLDELWQEESTNVGGIGISIDSDTISTDPVELYTNITTVKSYRAGSKGQSIQVQHAGVGEAFGNLGSSIKEKYQAAIQFVRKGIEKSSVSMVDTNLRIEGEIYYSSSQAGAALIRMEKSPGDGVVTEMRDGRFRTVPLTQYDMHVIANYLRSGDTASISNQRLWWLKEDEKIVHFMHDDFFEYRSSLLEGFYFSTFNEAKQHAAKSDVASSVAFITHINGYYGWLLANSQDIETALNHTIKTMPPESNFENFLKVSLPTIALSKSADMPVKAFGLRSGEQLHYIDQEYFDGRKIWFANKILFSSDIKPNPIITFINGHASEGQKLYRYLNVEMDRNKKLGGDLAISSQNESEKQLTENVQGLVVSQMWHWSKNKALEIVNTSVSRLNTLKNNYESLQAYLLGYLQLKSDYETTLFFEALGLDGGQISKAKTVFSNKKKFHNILLGNTEDSISIEWFQGIIGKTFKELDSLKKDIKSNEIVPIELEGGFGNAIRQATYKYFGLDIKPANYPHEKEAKHNVAFSPTPGKSAEDFRTVREDLWINYSANKAQSERRHDYLVTALTVVAAVGLIIISGGIGSGVAAAFFAEGSAAFIATEVIVGAVAYTILQEGFDQLIGSGQLDSKKDYLGIGDLGKSLLYNIVFFGIFHGLGSALKGYGNTVRIAGTSSAFLAVEFVSYIASHNGELPKGHDLNLLLFRTFLMVALLEGGSILAKPYTRAMIKTGKGYRFNKFLDKIDTLHAETKLAQGQLSEILAKPKRTGKEQFELLDLQLGLLGRRAKVLREIQVDTEVSIEGRKDIDISTEITRIDDVIFLMKEARLQAEVGAHQIEIAGDIYTYRRGPSDLTGKNTAQAFKDYYGADNVTGPDAHGIITVKVGSARKVFMPENVNLSGSSIGIELSSPKYSEVVRGIEDGIVIVEHSKIPQIEYYYKKNLGRWEEINANTFSGWVYGENTIFLSEFTFNIADTALKAEVIRKGSGIPVLKANLRSLKTLKGFDAWERHEMSGQTDIAKLEKLKEMEEEGRTSRANKSLHKILEGKWELYQQKENIATLLKILIDGNFFKLPEVGKALRMNERKRTDAEGIIQAEMVEFLAAKQLNVVGKKQFISIEPARRIIGVDSIESYRTNNTDSDAIKYQKLREFTNPVTGEVTVWESLGEIDILQTSADNKPTIGYEVKSGKRGSHLEAVEQLNKAFSNLQIVHGDGANENITYRVFERGAKATYIQDLTGVLDLSSATTITPKTVGVKFTPGIEGFDITVNMTDEPVESSGFNKKNRSIMEETAKQLYKDRMELLED